MRRILTVLAVLLGFSAISCGPAWADDDAHKNTPWGIPYCVGFYNDFADPTLVVRNPTNGEVMFVVAGFFFTSVAECQEQIDRYI